MPWIMLLCVIGLVQGVVLSYCLMALFTKVVIPWFDKSSQDVSGAVLARNVLIAGMIVGAPVASITCFNAFLTISMGRNPLETLYSLLFFAVGEAIVFLSDRKHKYITQNDET